MQPLRCAACYRRFAVSGIEDPDAERLNADFIAMPGHKGLLGPQGTGILRVKTLPAPLMSGGTGSESIIQSMPEYLPDRAEAGTHNVVGISGLCEGIKYVLGKGVNKIGSYEAELCGTAAERLSRVPSLEVFRGKAGSSGRVLSFRHTLQLTVRTFVKSSAHAELLPDAACTARRLHTILREPTKPALYASAFRRLRSAAR